MLLQYDQATPRAAQLSGEDPTPVYAEGVPSRQHRMTLARANAAPAARLSYPRRNVSDGPVTDVRALDPTKFSVQSTLDVV